MYEGIVFLKWSKACLVNGIMTFLFFFFQIQFASAEIVTDITQKKQWVLWAKPRICVIPLDLSICKMETEIYWVGSKKTNICLRSSEKKTAVHCWDNAQQGHLLQSIVMGKQITYWLAYFGKKEVLVETKIRLISFPQKRARRRRRHIWSLL